jgi:hypothetical protein
LHNLDAVAHGVGQVTGVTYYDPNRLDLSKEVFDNLVTDLAGGGGDDNHGELLEEDDAEAQVRGRTGQAACWRRASSFRWVQDE